MFNARRSAPDLVRHACGMLRLPAPWIAKAETDIGREITRIVETYRLFSIPLAVMCWRGLESRGEMKFLSQKLGNLELELAPITVLLGANGAGKSSALQEAKANVAKICPGKKVLYVEGGRAITLQHTLQLNAKNVSQYQDYSQAKKTYESKRQSRLSDRVYDALMMLERKELAVKAEHSDAVQAWHSSGQAGSCPTRESAPLEKLFQQFHEIFPRLEIRYNAVAKTIRAKKGAAAEYSITSLSDGEKQVFSILADFVELGDEFGFIVVDEPELNLHPELAERVWGLVESEYPEKVFLYATHSLGFAMRKQVQRVIVISDTPENSIALDSPMEFSSIELHEFLGSIPGIIAANRVVVTEGEEKSFDSIFYRWILGDDQIEVMPAGGCEQVLNVCRRSGIWSRIGAKIALAGVVDRDFRTDEEGEAVVLHFREAESFLAIPALAVAADAHLAITSTRITSAAVVDAVMLNLNAERNLICANVVAARCGIRLGVSVEKSVLKGCGDTEDLLRKLKESSQEELAKAAIALGDEAIEGIIGETTKELDRIVREQDWSGALRLVDGKKIAHAVARMVGVRSAIDLMRSIAANIEVQSIPEGTAVARDLARLLLRKPV